MTTKAEKILKFLEGTTSPVRATEFYKLLGAETLNEKANASTVLMKLHKNGLIQRPKRGWWAIKNGSEKEQSENKDNGDGKKKEEIKERSFEFGSDNMTITLNMREHKDMYKALKKIADRDFRTMELQALSYIAHGLRNDLVWTGKGTIKVDEE